jgi:hypothetical protein
MISILVRIISIARMKLLMLPKAKKPNHFAYKMGLQTSIYIIKSKIFVDLAHVTIMSTQIGCPRFFSKITI